MSLDLFNLLPAVYRIRDAQIADSQQLPRGPLGSLLMLIQEQIDVFSYDLDQLYDDQFIETCAQWVIPYIGDLIGYQAVHGIAPSVDDPRAEVANTISLRRRKGTALVMEQLARDVTAWGAHAVEFFRILTDTQYMNHIRPYNLYAPDLGHWQPGIFIDTGFDDTAHTVDVRNISSGRGRYNIPNIGIFLWSLNAYSVTQAPAVVSAVSADSFRFNSLGMDLPLFHRAKPQGEQITAPATPANVADRLRRRVLCADLQKGIGGQYYGPLNSLAIYLNNKLVNPYQVRVADLAGPDGSWFNMPADNTYPVTVDPELGRLALPPLPAGSPAPTVTVSYYYGFNADSAGGSYARADTFVVEDPARIFPFPDTATPARYTTLQGALAFATTPLAGTGEVAIEISGYGVYPQTGTLTATLPAGTTFELRAAEGSRPTLLFNGELSVTGAASSSFIINGLLIGGVPGMAPGNPAPIALVHIPAQAPDGSTNNLGELSIAHCTLVPGWSVDTSGDPRFLTAPAIVAEAPRLQIEIEKSIVGAIRSDSLATVCACDSIIDATDRTEIAYSGLDGESGGGALTLNGCTVIGKVHATLLSLVSNTIFWSALTGGDRWASSLVADRQQQGCVRFSFLPIAAITPRRFECVEQSLGSPQPVFYALRYGDPGYSKLVSGTPDVVRRGADDGGEMGAFHFGLGPLRETDLGVRVQEYLPVGFQFGIIYEN
jgi:hypothetical protein